MEFNIADLFECVADAVPERTAVVCADERVTYAQLEAGANQIAHVLSDAGARAGEHVALYLPNSIEHLSAMLGCYKLRAVPINVNTRYVDDELVYLFDDADAVAVIHDASNADRARRVIEKSERARFAIDVDGDRPSISAASSARDFGPRSGDDHYVLYTGGTTGMPKGVVWRQEDIFFAAMGGGNPGGPPITEPDAIARSVIDNPAQRLRAFLDVEDPGPPQFVSLALGPLMHASGQWSALGTLLGGGKVVLYDQPHVDMRHVLGLIEREQVNAMNLVGDASARPLLATLAELPNRWDTSSLLLLGSGGSILSGDAKSALLEALPTVVAIVEGVGSSESPAQAVAVTTRSGAVAPSLTFGAKPETMVVDDDLRPVPHGSGIVGRLATRGRVPLGYYKDEARSASTFVEIDGARWSLPGDMATIDSDGAVHLLGRGTLCINTGGEKVYPEEVEAVLKTCAGVDDAVVVGAPDSQWGEQVVAIIASSDPPSLKTLQSHCRAQLAGYKVPRALHVVDQIARTDAGKADYAWAKRLVSDLTDRTNPTATE
ncbi:MAG TPA: AMP-binding protein [Acidimicrobiia bacterium]|nr:AMP-binding protein [Acidimicrobiia bacterium]